MNQTQLKLRREQLRRAEQAEIAADPELIPIEQAASELGIEPKALRGRIQRNGPGDPIGGLTHVYAWSITDEFRQACGK